MNLKDQLKTAQKEKDVENIYRAAIINSLDGSEITSPYSVDGLLVKMGCSKEFNVDQPFKFMEQIAIETKGNFFESRTMEYQKAKLNETISFTDDF